MIVLHDGGEGEAIISLAYFRRNRHLLGFITAIYIDASRTFSMEIQGSNGIMLLSGVTCGYRGTSPSGSLQILRELGVRDKQIETVVELKRHVAINLRGKPTLEPYS